MKPNRFILAAILGLALAFTISCSDDDGGGTGACKYIETYYGKAYEECTENEDWTKEECEREEAGGGTFYDSCPSDYTLKCKNKKSTYYIYGDVLKDCDDGWWNN